MFSFKKSFEDNIEVTGDAATNSASVVIINCVMEKGQQLDGVAFVGSNIQEQDEQLRFTELRGKQLQDLMEI